MNKVIVGLFAVATAVFVVGKAVAEPVKLKFAFFTSTKERTWTTSLGPFVEAVNAEGKGIIEIQPFPNGALGKAMPQQAQLILDGIADIAFVLPAITPGRFPENEVMELPGAVLNVADATNVYSGMLLGGKIRGFESFHVLGALGGDPFPINTRAEINGLSDLKGKKIRVGSGLQARTVKELGMVPILIPINEAPEAIARGTIDGVAIQPVPMVDFGVSRVVSNHYFAGVGFAPLTVLMSKAKYDALPKQAKEILDKYSGKWLGDLYNREFGAASAQVVKQLAADPKRKVLYPTDAEKKELAAAYKVVIDEWVAKSPRNAELYKDLLAVQKQVRGN
jgi:TRAP-type transport system periplasmic protein